MTTQLLELGIPVVVAVNMIDLVERNGDKIDLNRLSQELGCPVMAVSALKGKGTKEVAAKAIEVAKNIKLHQYLRSMTKLSCRLYRRLNRNFKCK